MRILLLLTTAVLCLAALTTARAQESPATLDEALAAAQAGDLPKAISMSTQLVERDPKDIRARILRGRL